jgi:hypothetical protein
VAPQLGGMTELSINLTILVNMRPQHNQVAISGDNRLAHDQRMKGTFD